MCTSLKSFVMVDSQVVGCPPATFLLNLLLASQYAFLADVSSGSLMRCPNQASLRRWIVLVHGSIPHTVYSLLFVMFLVLTICLRKFLWNESIFLLSAFERDHSSQLYKNTGATKHKKLLILDARGLWLVHKIVLYLLNVAQANCFLLFISSEFPNRDPRNLHFFQSSFPFLFILYSSVLSSFTSRFLSFSSFAAISFMLSFTSSTLVTQLVSSAYCCSKQNVPWLFIFLYLLCLQYVWSISLSKSMFLGCLNLGFAISRALCK